MPVSADHKDGDSDDNDDGFNDENVACLQVA